MRKLSRTTGFTLVEIMIVVAIIALLAAIAIPNLMRAKIEGNQASAKATLKSIGTALENYYTVNNDYPTDPTSLIGASPPYLNKDYFTGTHNGYTFGGTLNSYDYTILAVPSAPSQGTVTYTLSTGSNITP